MKIKGNGSIRQVKNSKGEVVKNSWQLILSLGNDPLTGKRRQKCRHFRGSRTKAQRALHNFRLEVEHGLKLDADKMIFSEYAQQWYDAREASGRLAPATLKRNLDILVHLNSQLATVPLGDIDATVVRNLYTTLARDGVGQRSLQMTAMQLNQIMRQAVNDDIILRNPCDRVEAPKAPKSKRGIALDKAGVTRLVKALKAEESKVYPHANDKQQRLTSDMAHVTAIRVIMATGLRRGEVLGLLWGDVNLVGAQLNIHQSLNKVTGELTSTKTESGNRDIALDNQIVEDLLRWKNRQEDYLRCLGIKQDDNTPVITSEVGDHMDGDHLERWWRRFRKKHDFEKFRIHDLRHSHATALVSSGINIKAVSSRMGHSSVGITLDLYAHAQREDDEKAAAVIGKLMATPVPNMAQVTNL